MAKIDKDDLKRYSLVKTILNPEARLSVAGTIVVADNDGKEWAVPFAYFGFEMKPYSEKQPYEFSTWLSAVMTAKCKTWSNVSYTQEELFDAYRDGKSPNDLYPSRSSTYG